MIRNGKALFSVLYFMKRPVYFQLLCVGARMSDCGTGSIEMSVSASLWFVILAHQNFFIAINAVDYSNCFKNFICFLKCLTDLNLSLLCKGSKLFLDLRVIIMDDSLIVFLVECK